MRRRIWQAARDLQFFFQPEKQFFLFVNKNNWFLELGGKTLNLWQNSGVTAISFISPRLILFSLFKPNIKQILNFSISDNIGATKRLKKTSLWYKNFWSLSRLATYKPTEVVKSHYILLIIRCLPSPPPSKELSYSPDHQVSPLSPPSSPGGGCRVTLPVPPVTSPVVTRPTLWLEVGWNLF